jgi:ATP-binding cassette subfamily C (CFTR/MRP) protein 1
MNSIVQAMVSVRGLSTFLQSGELQPNAVVYEPPNGKPIMEIKDGEFRWNTESAQPTIEGIDVRLGSGELVAVLGRVGSGKTSLLSAIAGEMHKSDGQVFVRGSVAYAPQNAWYAIASFLCSLSGLMELLCRIMSATVRDNIIFCHEFEQEFYDIVLDGVCVFTALFNF